MVEGSEEWWSGVIQQEPDELSRIHVDFPTDPVAAQSGASSSGDRSYDGSHHALNMRTKVLTAYTNLQVLP